MEDKYRRDMYLVTKGQRPFPTVSLEEKGKKQIGKQHCRNTT